MRQFFAQTIRTSTRGPAGKRHPQPRTGASLLALLIAAAGLTTGCASEQAPAEAGDFAIEVAGLATCGGTNAKPLSEIKSLKLVVREPNSTGGLSVVDSQTVSVSGGGTVNFKEVPAGSPREVTLLGYNAGGKEPAWYARRTGVNIKKNVTTDLDVTLMAMEDFTCVGTTGGQPNVLFPSATVMEDGKVLIAGGFTNSTTDGTTIKLEAPSDQAWVFDPNRGTFAAVGSPMKEARAGHSAIYLTKLNQVLIVGGTQQMSMPANGASPPTWKATNGVNLTWEVYDVATGTFLSPKNGGSDVRKRVMPILLPLAGDNVAVLGGAPWPATDDLSYASGDLFLAAKNAGEETGHFASVAGQLGLQANRGGAAAAYIGPTQFGTSRYLLWGGNVANSNKIYGRVAERFEESTEPGVGEFYSDFMIEGDYAATESRPLFFPTLTAIGRGRDKNGKPTDDGRFVSFGGVRYDVQTGVWTQPSPDDAWLLVLKEPTDSVKGKITTTRIAGMKQGMYLHQTQLAGSGLAVLTGGFSTFGDAASYQMQVFDVAAGKLLSEANFPGATRFVSRGGHAALTLPNDCVLFYGGAGQLGPDGLSSNGKATSDIYCPRRLAP
jgi:hypothetical protein